MATLNEIKKSLKHVEGNIRKQIADLKKGKLPISPAARRQVLNAIRKLRTELNRNLTKLERMLAPPKAPRRKAR